MLYAKVAGGLTKAQNIPKLIHFFQQTSGRMVFFLQLWIPLPGAPTGRRSFFTDLGSTICLKATARSRRCRPTSETKLKSQNINRYQQISTVTQWVSYMFSIYNLFDLCFLQPIPGLGQAYSVAPPRLDDASEAGPIAPGLHLRLLPSKWFLKAF